MTRPHMVSALSGREGGGDDDDDAAGANVATDGGESMPGIVSILCLAHYCDTHGPTPMMVTETIVPDCQTCVDGGDATSEASEEAAADDQGRGPSRSHLPRSAPLTTPSTSLETNSSLALSSSSPAASHNLTSHPRQVDTAKASIPPSTNAKDASPSIIAKSLPGKTAYMHRRDSSFRKTYDDNDKKRATPCDNCAMTLPPSPDRSEPTVMIRTKKMYQRVGAPRSHGPSPPKSTASTSMSDSGDSDARADLGPKQTARLPERSKMKRRKSSVSSYISSIPHAHYLEYRSTKEPLEAASFSLIRHSCLRTLSCEVMPPTSTTSSSSPTSPFINGGYPSTSANTTASGGPIFFGEPLSGYTTAFTFRIPDPTARGRRRVYALMALSTQSERLAVQTFAKLSTAFRSLAAWIQGLVELENEKLEQAIHSPRPGDDAGFAHPPLLPASTSAFASRSSSSSFLSGRSRSSADGGKMAGHHGLGLRARGLPELVGQPDFFYQLHVRFVRLLAELGMLFGS